LSLRWGNPLKRSSDYNGGQPMAPEIHKAL
jgi:hypothetical protein